MADDREKNLKVLKDHFQTIPSKSLALIATGKADAVDLAVIALDSRGEDRDGNWKGFKK